MHRVTQKSIKDSDIDLARVEKRLSEIAEEIKINNKNNLTDINVICEEIFGQILNKLYDIKLVSMSAEVSGNYIAVDLVDYEKRIAYQVTSQNIRNKIDRTLEKFNSSGMYKDIDEVHFLILSSDEHRYNGKDTKCLNNGRIFSYKENIMNFKKIKHRFAEIEEKKSQYAETTDELIINNIQVKERYLKQLIVSLYIQATIPNVYFCDEDYKNKCKFDETKKFRQLFNFCFIKASRPLDDDESDHSHMLSKQMIKMVKMDEKWNELVESLPDEVLKPIQEKEIDKAIRSTSLESLKDTIATLEQTNGGKSGELMLDMQISEEDISDLLQRITTATYDIDGYYLGESSQGLGYSNMIYIHLQLKEYEKNIDPLKVNMFFLEEPESHMHPQMQQVFIKYLLDYYESKLQGLITTHSNEMVRVAGISHLRVIRHVGNFKSELYDLSILVKDLKKSEEMEDKELANFFDWFFEIGYSEIVFADRAIFYEGDTERLYIRKVMTLEKYKKLKQQYVAFIQVGGAYAKNYEKLIKLLGIKSLIITDIDYGKSEIVIEDVKKSKTTNATIEYFYSINNSTDTPTVEELYSWKETGGNIIEDLIYVCFQTKDDGYARTLEEAMINKYFDMDVSKCYKKSDWKEKRKDSELKFSIPRMKNKKEIADDDMVSVRDILAATSGNKTDFMCSVIMKDYVKKMLPDYIERGLEWLMK